MSEDLTPIKWFWKHIPNFSGELLFEETLYKHTFYRVGGPTRVLAIPKNLEDLKLISEGIEITKIPTAVLGFGSNILVSDNGYDGLVIKTTKLNLEVSAREEEGKLIVKTGASLPLSVLLRNAIQGGWGGLEFLAGIPGTVGGAVFMNAGTHLGETKDKLYKVVVYFFKKPPVSLDIGDTRFIEFTQNQFKYEYRKNLFVPEEALIYAAEWIIHKDTPSNIKTAIDKILVRRKETQPIDHPSCGSVFKNPKNKKAWQVIDDLWLRGYQIGGAQFSEKHCNFIINLGTAKASDIKALIDLAKSRAKQELGIELEEEVKYLGF